MAQLRQDAERAESILARIPAGLWGLPDDLMGSALFLASEASNYLNGAIVPVDGGWLSDFLTPCAIWKSRGLWPSVFEKTLLK